MGQLVYIYLDPCMVLKCVVRAGRQQAEIVMGMPDIVIVGAGTAGMPCAIEAIAAGARVLVVEQADEPGGALHVSLGQLSGAGSQLQAARGITDSAAAHLEDITRINRGTGRGDLLARTVAGQGATIDWLMQHGFDMDPACPAILHLHEAYRLPRTYWGVDGGLSVLKVLKPLFAAAMASPLAQMRYGTRVTGLEQDTAGRVTGVRLSDSNGDTVVHARAVVLATGGYGGNPAMFARLTGGRPLVTAAMPQATGLGIDLAIRAGAALSCPDMFLPTYAAVAPRLEEHQVIWRQMPALTPQSRQPWELHLDPAGARFVREDDDSVDRRENALNTLPDLSFWCVFDKGVADAAPPLLPGWTAEELAAAWGDHPSFVQADSLDALARATGMDPPVLAQSVAAYNAGIADGTPDMMGRMHRPRTLSGPHWLAVRMHGMVLKTPSGIHVDGQLRATRADDTAIPGLYAVGECIGGSSLSGKGFVSGMSVTPALTLGRWLGRTLAEERTLK
jgi:fumarate reductase flavoprotein subunit